MRAHPVSWFITTGKSSKAALSSVAERAATHVLLHELEQTKLVLHETIEAALERGQKIDDLIVKSNDLSGSSKMFYKTARKQNQCCQYM